MPLNPDGSTLRVSRPLTNVSIAYAQTQPGIAERVFPTVPVQRQGDLYWKFNREAWFRSIAERRAPATESVGGGWDVETDSYYAHVYAVHQDLDDQTMANADSIFNLEADAARWTISQLELKKELIFHEKFFNAAAWGTNTVDAGGTFDTGTGATSPVVIIPTKADEMEEATGLRPNTLVVDTKTHRALLNNPDILDRIKYTQTGIVSEALLAAVLGVDRYFVSRAVQAATVGSETLSHIATDGQALLCYAAPRPGLRQPSAGYTFAWTGLLGAGALGIRTKRWRMEEIESIRIESEMAFDMKLVAQDLGFLWTNTV